jgi:excisionase family DNA binding protein
VNGENTLPVLVACFNQFNSFALDDDPRSDSEDQEAVGPFVKMISESWGCKVCADNGDQSHHGTSRRLVLQDIAVRDRRDRRFPVLAASQARCLSMATHLELLLTPKEAAEFLGVPSGTLAQWRSERRGPPYIKLEDRLVRYRRSDLEEYLAAHAVATDGREPAQFVVGVSGR